MPKPIRTETLLMTTSTSAKKFWGKAVEDKLPRPVIGEDPALLLPSIHLMNITQYARGAESRGEWLFRKNYLHPIFDHYSDRENTSWEEDAMGNMCVKVGTSRVLHVGHIDTVHDDAISPLQEISLDKNIVSLAPIKKNSKPVMTSGTRWVEDVDVKYDYITYELPKKKTRSLGADDGCAVAIMLYLIANNVEGTYLFTRGEEIGCVGTHYIIENNTLINMSDYDMAIEVDRKGTEEILCKMGIGKTASQSFGKSLAAQLGLGHHVNGKGSVTDIAHFSKHIPECVNIAAGYNLQHSDRETTDIDYLDRLGLAMLQVSWDELTIKRTAGDHALKGANLRGVHGGSGGYGYGNLYDGYSRSHNALTNSYGDYAANPAKETRTFTAIFNALPSYQQEAYVRSNSKFIIEILCALNVSPKEIDALISGVTSDDDVLID